MIQYYLPRVALVTAAVFSAFLPTLSHATVGVDSAGGGAIGPAHAAHAAGLDLGRTVALIIYGNGTATGTLVPSSEPGVLKFLTAAHNVDKNSDGVLDAGAANIQLFFGNTPGTNGAGATYSVVATPAQIAMNPNWATSGGSATHDMAVVSFTFAQIAAVNGGTTIQTSAVSSTNPLGMAAVLGGHGDIGDGTVTLPVSGENPEDQNPDVAPPGVNDLDGVLKTGTNTVDFVGVPGPLAAPTVSPASGTVILVDFDKPDGSTSTFGAVTGGPIEAATAVGDSGSALLVDTNGDGKLEVVGVLNGGDNPFGGASQFGDLSQYAPVLTASNLAFLAAQNVFVGTSVAGASAGEFGGAGFSIVDLNAIRNFNSGVASAQQAQSHATQSISAHLGSIQTHVNRFNRGTSRLENVGGDEVTLADMAGFGSRRWEFWVGGDLGRADTEPNGVSSGLDSRFGASTVGIDFLATSNFIVGMTWSHLYGKSKAAANDLSFESNGNAIGFNISGNWGGLNSSLIYSYAASDNDMSRSIGATRAFANPDSSAHTLDWTISYNFRHEGWVHGPTAGLRYTNGSIDNYAEGSNAPVAGLMSVSGQDFEIFRVNAGYNVAYHIAIDAGKVVPYFGATWIHESRNANTATASFQGTPFFGIGGGGIIPVGTGPSASVGSGNSSSSFLNLRLGVELLTTKGLSLNLQGYVNTFRDDMVDAGGGLQIGYAF